MLILLSLLSCFAKITAWRSGPPQADYDGMTFSEPRLVFGSTFGSRRARFLRVVFIGGIQVPRAGGRPHYQHALASLTGPRIHTRVLAHGLGMPHKIA